MTALLVDSTSSRWAVSGPLVRAQMPAPAAIVLPFPAPGGSARGAVRPETRQAPLRLTRRGRAVLVLAVLAAVVAGGAAHGLAAPIDGASGVVSISGVEVAPGVPLGTGGGVGAASAIAPRAARDGRPGGRS